MNVKQLNSSIDSLKKQQDSIQHYFTVKQNQLMKGFLPANSVKKIYVPEKRTYTRLFPDSLKKSVELKTIERFQLTKNAFQDKMVQLDANKKEIRSNRIEWHRKYSLSLACLVLFFIGAPLGAIIRKGGLGMPMMMAIVFFLIFHLCIILVH